MYKIRSLAQRVDAATSAEAKEANEILKDMQTCMLQPKLGSVLEGITSFCNILGRCLGEKT